MSTFASSFLIVFSSTRDYFPLALSLLLPKSITILPRPFDKPPAIRPGRYNPIWDAYRSEGLNVRAAGHVPNGCGGVVPGQQIRMFPIHGFDAPLGNVIDQAAIKYGAALPAENRREWRRARRCEDQVGQRLGRCAFPDGDSLRSEPAHFSEVRMQRGTKRLFNLIAEETKQGGEVRPNPFGRPAEENTDIGSLVKFCQIIGTEEFEKCARYILEMGENRAAIQEISGITILRVTSRYLFEIIEGGCSTLRKNKTGHRCSGADRGHGSWLRIQKRGNCLRRNLTCQTHRDPPPANTTETYPLKNIGCLFRAKH